jgi:hypothetical protein
MEQTGQTSLISAKRISVVFLFFISPSKMLFDINIKSYYFKKKNTFSLFLFMPFEIFSVIKDLERKW